jgi:hypothetical protein
MGRPTIVTSAGERCGGVSATKNVSLPVASRGSSTGSGSVVCGSARASGLLVAQQHLRLLVRGVERSAPGGRAPSRPRRLRRAEERLPPRRARLIAAGSCLTRTYPHSRGRPSPRKTSETCEFEHGADHFRHQPDTFEPWHSEGVLRPLWWPWWRWGAAASRPRLTAERRDGRSGRHQRAGGAAAATSSSSTTRATRRSSSAASASPTPRPTAACATRRACGSPPEPRWPRRAGSPSSSRPTARRP